MAKRGRPHQNRERKKLLGKGKAYTGNKEGRNPSVLGVRIQLVGKGEASYKSKTREKRLYIKKTEPRLETVQDDDLNAAATQKKKVGTIGSKT